MTELRSSAARPAPVFGLIFFATLPLFVALFFAFPVLHDTDSYYHLAIGRAYAEQGQLHELPWVRFSLLSEGFGDKELLFHWFLAPFALGDLGTAGGRWALAVLNSAVAGALGTLSVAAIGRWGLLAVPLVWIGSLEFFGRVIRLRPELLALLLLLAALAAAGTRRYRVLGALSFVFTLSYTAFHALLGLCGLWFLHQGWMRRRWDWSLLLYPTLGTGLALLLHPNFPHNLVIWKVQSIDFFLWKDRLDVGREIAAGSSADLLIPNLGWLLGMAVLVLSSHAVATRRGDDPMADRSLVAAVVFAVLYLLGRRFSIYAVPFATLALLFELRRRGRTVSSPTCLPGRGHLPLVLTAALVLLVSAVPAGRQIVGMATARGGELEREEDWRLAASVLPDGAHVAAPWGQGQLFLYFAPQARFLNVLDPVFMALPYPEIHARERSVFEAREPDTALAVAAELDSDYLLVSRFQAPPRLLRTLDRDPRWRLLYDGYTRVYGLDPAGNRDFVLDWRLVPPGEPLPVSGDVDVSRWRAWPRGRDPELGAYEGFVELRRVATAPGPGADDCLALVADLPSSLEERRGWEVVPWGRSRLWIDGTPGPAFEQASRSLPGEGVEWPVAAGARLSVVSCFDPASRRGGFSLLAAPAMP
jgi:hypothetical protein